MYYLVVAAALVLSSAWLPMSAMLAELAYSPAQIAKLPDRPAFRGRVEALEAPAEEAA